MVELNEPFEILNDIATHARFKSEQVDSEGQVVLTCDLYKYTIAQGDDESVPVLVYADKAWIKGEQPFEIPVEEDNEISA